MYVPIDEWYLANVFVIVLIFIYITTVMQVLF